MSKIKILVVDDDPGIQAMAKNILIKEDFEVVEAVDGLDGLEKFEETNPDMAILDIMMPKLNGIELLQKIKEKDSGFPVIMFTAYASMERAIEAMRYGAKDFIVKPFSVKDFIAIVNRNRENIELKKALKKSEEKYHFLFENASDSIFVHNFNGNIIDVNENAGKRFGYKKSELININFKKLEVADSSKAVASRQKTLKKDGMVTYETVYVKKDKSKVPVEITASVIRYEGLDVVQSFARDVTQRKSLEKQLKQAHENLQKKHEELQKEYGQLKERVEELQFNKVDLKAEPVLNDEEKGILDRLGTSSLIKYTSSGELKDSIEKLLDIYFKKGNPIIFITSHPRAAKRYKGVSKSLQEGAIQIVEMPSGLAPGTQPSPYIKLPMTHLFLFGDLIRKIPSNSVIFLEPLSQIILSRGFETTYQFLENYAEELESRDTVFIGLLKSSAHSQEEVGGIENIFLKILSVSDGVLV